MINVYYFIRSKIKLFSLLVTVLLFFTTVLPIYGQSQEKKQQSSTEFYRILAAKQFASFGDGVKAVHVLIRGKLVDMPFENRVQKLKEREIIPASWKKEKDASLDRGELAYMICKVLGIKGGLITRIFGMSERYAYKELVYRKVMAQGSQSRLVPGEEVLSVIRSASRYRKKHMESN